MLMLRKRMPSMRGRLAAVTGVVLALSPLAAAQEAQQAALLFEHSGFDSFMVDEKDRPFERALAMFPERLRELRDEIPDMRDLPEPVVDLILDLAPRPMRLAVLPKGMDPQTNAPSVSIVLSLQAESQEEAQQITGRILELIEMSGADVPVSESPTDATQHLISTPGGPLAFGPGEDAGGWAFRAAFGPALDLDAAFDSLMPVPDNVQLMMRGRLDMQVLSPFISMALGMGGGHEGQMLLAQLTQAGLLGPDAVAFEFGMGYTADAMVSRFVVERAGLAMDAGYVKEPLDLDAFRIVPRDASVVGLSQWEIMSLWQMFESISDFAPDFDLAQIQQWSIENLHIDPRADLLEPIGTTWCWYNSATTGGDTLLAGVLAVSLDDETRFRDTLETLADLANEQLADVPYVRLARQQMWGEEVYALQIRGLPIPVELSCALAGGHLVTALTPQAVVAAVKQINGAEDSILENPSFRRSMPSSRQMQRAVAYTFMDAEKLAPCGYPLLQLAGSAVANAMRSPHSDRDPGALIPLYNDFVADVDPIVAISFWDGEDFVQEMRGDHSLLVNKATAFGYLGRSPIAPMIVGGMLAGAGAGALQEMDVHLDQVVEATGRRDEVKSMSHLRQIAMGMQIYASEFNDRTPGSLADLVEHEILTGEVLESPFGPVWDDKGDYLIRPNIDLSRVQEPWRTVAAYDRAMYSHHDRVAVAYADGHVEVLTIEEFEMLLELEQNADFNWDLPGR